MTETKFIKRKKTNPKKAIVLLVVLIIIILIWNYLEELMSLIF